LVLGATNRPDMLDPAVLRPGRFDEIVDIRLPDQESRRLIFEVHLRNKPLAPGVSASSLAASTDGFSGADIQGVCTKAALRAVRRAVVHKIGKPADEAPVVIAPDDLEVALKEAQGNE
jgi:transitional endoplasmic reticulum ATPase